jgi:hypothetical protein
MFVAGYLLGIPVVSWLLEIVGGFLVVLTVYTFIHEARKAMNARREERHPPDVGMTSPGAIQPPRPAEATQCAHWKEGS